MNPKIEEICKIAYSYKETVYFTYNITQELIKKGLIGSFVECGVAAGAQIAAMKLAMQDLNIEYRIYGFDSFEGIPLAGPKDAEQPGIGLITHDISKPERERLVSSGITVHSRGNVRLNFNRFGLSMKAVFLVKGWFQDTLPMLKNHISPILLLRLDGDLYESTMCCLQNLYSNLVVGGVCIVDDWGLPGAKQAVIDYFGDNMPEIKIVEGSGTVGYFIKRHP